MTFFYLLKEMSFDWNKAKEVFYNLTDTQLAWVNSASALARDRAESKAEFGSKGKLNEEGVTRKSFDLRRDRMDVRR